MVRLAPNEVTSYRLTFPDRGSVGTVKTQAHDTKTGNKVDIVIPNPDALIGSSSATHTDRHIYTPTTPLPGLQPRPNWPA